MPIVVGGTGLYFQALVEGLAPVPDIPPAVREQGRKRLDQLGNIPFHEELSRKDPLMAERIRPSDRWRMVRAWEVIEATGISLAEWQRRQTGTHCPGRFAKIVLSVPRETLYARCDGRFEEMVTSGAVDEVRDLLARAVPASHPVMKAVGVRELARCLSGEDTLDVAVAAGQRLPVEWPRPTSTAARPAESHVSRLIPVNPDESRFVPVNPGESRFIPVNPYCPTLVRRIPHPPPRRPAQVVLPMGGAHEA